MGIEGVDGRKTLSNHVIEVQQTLGIEAARKCIIEEIKFTMGSHGMSIDARHMMLLADVMTFRVSHLKITIREDYISDFTRCISFKLTQLVYENRVKSLE